MRTFIFSLLASLPLFAFCQTFDLTGYWKAETGACYQIRQVGNVVVWGSDENVFYGSITGNNLSGLWYDLPQNAHRNFSQAIAFRVESNSRIVKVSESVVYNGSTFSRVSGPCNSGAIINPPQPPNSNAIKGTWGTQANENDYRGKVGQRFTFYFPPGGTISGRIWGTDLYTDDSSIATAAVHAGLITAQNGGTVTIEIRPGAASYTGSARNGVTSNNYGGWSGSFSFVR